MLPGVFFSVAKSASLFSSQDKQYFTPSWRVLDAKCSCKVYLPFLLRYMKGLTTLYVILNMMVSRNPTFGRASPTSMHPRFRHKNLKQFSCPFHQRILLKVICGLNFVYQYQNPISASAARCTVSGRLGKNQIDRLGKD